MFLKTRLKRLHYNWIFAFLFVFSFVFTLVRQNNVNNFYCEICSDKAGYYMYLPAIFYYGFNASEYPKNFDAKHGYGFHLDNPSGIITTKFTSGVAILLVPFYSLGVVLDKALNLKVEPYSRYFLVFVNLGASFYLILGLFYLSKWFSQFTSAFNSLVAVSSIYFSTNLLYYSIDENLMSHLYSFTLFSILLYTTGRFLSQLKPTHFYISAFIFFLAVLIRPTNILFAPIALVANSQNLRNTLKILLNWLTIKRLIAMGIIVFLVYLPQVLYWKLAYGSFVKYTYTGEGFINWNTPKIAQVLFAPQSGLFTYTPVSVLLLAMGMYLLPKHVKNLSLVLVVFCLVTYLCASWSNPSFGECNFGKRPFIEFYPILFLPLVYFLNVINNSYKKITIGVLSFFALLNGLFIIEFDTCFLGEIWDWKAYVVFLSNSLFLH